MDNNNPGICICKEKYVFTGQNYCEACTLGCLECSASKNIF